MALAQQRWVKLQNYDLPDDVRQVLNQRLAELGQPGVASARPAQPRRPHPSAPARQRRSILRSASSRV
jgi:hypothetical protein